MLSNPAVCVPLVRAARDLEFPVREAHQAERAKLSLRRPERLPGMWESKRGAPQDANSGTPNKRLIQLPSRFRLVLFSLVTSGRCATRCRFAASSCSAKRHRSAYKDTRPEWRERKHVGSELHPPRHLPSSQKRCLTPSQDPKLRRRIVRHPKGPERMEIHVLVRSENTPSARTDSSVRAPSRPKAGP